MPFSRRELAVDMIAIARNMATSPNISPALNTSMPAIASHVSIGTGKKAFDPNSNAPPTSSDNSTKGERFVIAFIL